MFTKHGTTIDKDQYHLCFRTSVWYDYFCLVAYLFLHIFCKILLFVKCFLLGLVRSWKTVEQIHLEQSMTVRVTSRQKSLINDFACWHAALLSRFFSSKSQVHLLFWRPTILILKLLNFDGTVVIHKHTLKVDNTIRCSIHITYKEMSMQMNVALHSSPQSVSFSRDSNLHNDQSRELASHWQVNIA